MRKLQKLASKLYLCTGRSFCVIRETLVSGRSGDYLVYDLDTVFDDYYQGSVIGRFKTVGSCSSFLLSLFRR